MKTNTLQKNIMRRVYYAFAVRVATHPLTLQALVAALALWGIAQLVWVERVVTGIMNVPVGELIPHLLRVLSNADTVSLIVFGIFVFSVLSFGIQLRAPQVRLYRSLSSV